MTDKIPSEILQEGETYEDLVKTLKKKLKKKKVGRPVLTKAEKLERKAKREAEKLLGNFNKSTVANSKPRIGGRFVSTNPEVTKQKEERKELLSKVSEQAFITDEDREYIGTDSKKFFERAMQKAATWVEGMNFAKELKNLQHATLSAQQITQEVIVTQKTLKWVWDEGDTLIEAEKVERLEDGRNDDDRASDRGTLQTPCFTSEDPQKLEKV